MWLGTDLSKLEFVSLLYVSLGFRVKAVFSVV